MSDGLTIAEIQRQVRELKDAKGFDITLEQRLAHLMTEVGEVARETNAAGAESAEGAPGMEIYDAIWNLLDPVEMADARDLEEAFHRKASLNEDREW